MMIQSTEDDANAIPLPCDGLPAFLAHQGMSPPVILHTLDQLRMVKSVRLWTYAEEREWERSEGSS